MEQQYGQPPTHNQFPMDIERPPMDGNAWPSARFEGQGLFSDRDGEPQPVPGAQSHLTPSYNPHQITPEPQYPAFVVPNSYNYAPYMQGASSSIFPGQAGFDRYDGLNAQQNGQNENIEVFDELNNQRDNLDESPRVRMQWFVIHETA